MRKSILVKICNPIHYHTSPLVWWFLTLQLHNIFKMMKLFNKTIFSIFGMALLATGFVACSSDDSNTVNEEKVEQVNSSSEDSSNTVFSYPDCHNKVAVRYGTLKFHRPSRSCYSGFSMCTRHD